MCSSDLRCLDAFAGTGALGLEAASRGAAQVVLVEQDGALIEQLKKLQVQLKAEAVRVQRGDGSVVPNLYAAGEVLGSGVTLGKAFAPGMMLTPALALGRWLGNTLPVGADRKPRRG